MFAVLNMLGLGKKGIFLEGKNWTTKGGLVGGGVQINFFTFWEVRQEKQGSPFFNLRLERCTCSWLVENKETSRDCF